MAYKSFREQMQDCEKSGNLICVDISKYGFLMKTALVCIKYKSVCYSGLCKYERGVEDRRTK